VWNDYLADHVALIAGSYLRLTGRELVAGARTPGEAAQLLFDAPFAVVSHDAAPDPLFNYANRAALAAFEMRWEEFVGMPSRRSAQAPARAERERVLETVRRMGFVDNYRGVRVSGTGRRFMVEGATVWNLCEPNGRYLGQAARFDRRR
jgi:hypothetical protein